MPRSRWLDFLYHYIASPVEIYDHSCKAPGLRPTPTLDVSVSNGQSASGCNAQGKGKLNLPPKMGNQPWHRLELLELPPNSVETESPQEQDMAINKLRNVRAFLLSNCCQFVCGTFVFFIIFIVFFIVFFQIVTVYSGPGTVRERSGNGPGTVRGRSGRSAWAWNSNKNQWFFAPFAHFDYKTNGFEHMFGNMIENTMKINGFCTVPHIMTVKLSVLSMCRHICLKNTMKINTFVHFPYASKTKPETAKNTTKFEKKRTEIGKNLRNLKSQNWLNLKKNGQPASRPWAHCATIATKSNVDWEETDCTEPDTLRLHKQTVQTRGQADWQRSMRPITLVVRVLSCREH